MSDFAPPNCKLRGGKSKKAQTNKICSTQIERDELRIHRGEMTTDSEQKKNNNFSLSLSDFMIMENY
jgi:hypothetical protein